MAFQVAASKIRIDYTSCRFGSATSTRFTSIRPGKEFLFRNPKDAEGWDKCKTLAEKEKKYGTFPVLGFGKMIMGLLNYILYHYYCLFCQNISHPVTQEFLLLVFFVRFQLPIQPIHHIIIFFLLVLKSRLGLL